jgi:hypothetical protein
MLSRLKKNPDQADAVHAPAWHPNFRNFAELPDTKVVRTTFFVNGATALVTLALALAFFYQEYRLYFLHKQIDEAQQQIERNTGPSNQAIALFKKFQVEEKKTQEFDAFLKGNRLPVSDFLIRVGNTLPKNIALTSINYRDQTVALRGVIAGSPDAASGIASAYEKQLREDSEFGQRFESVSLTNLSRDASTGQLTLELIMKLRSTTKDKKQ